MAGDYEAWHFRDHEGQVDNIAMVATYICIVGNSQLAATFMHFCTAEEYLLCSLAPLSEQTSNYRIIRNDYIDH